MTEVERKTRRRRGKKRERERDRERERSRASCSHYLTYYTGSMPPRPSRGPTSLHLASLGSPFALLTGLPSASSFCLPPAVRSPSRLLTPDGFSRPLVSLSARARALYRRFPSRSRAPSFLFLLSTAASSPTLSAAPFARLDLTLLCPSRTLVLLLLPVPPRPPPPSILIDRSCTRAQSASPYHLVSSPSTRSRSSLSSILRSFFFLFALSFCLLSFRRLFLLRPLSDPLPPASSLPPLPPRARRPPLAFLLPARARGVV